MWNNSESTYESSTQLINIDTNNYASSSNRSGIRASPLTASQVHLRHRQPFVVFARNYRRDGQTRCRTQRNASCGWTGGGEHQPSAAVAAAAASPPASPLTSAVKRTLCSKSAVAETVFLLPSDAQRRLYSREKTPVWASRDYPWSVMEMWR